MTNNYFNSYDVYLIATTLINDSFGGSMEMYVSSPKEKNKLKANRYERKRAKKNGFAYPSFKHTFFQRPDGSIGDFGSFCLVVV